jgi:uncharacterized protein
MSGRGRQPGGARKVTMTERHVRFVSDGLSLAGILHGPDTSDAAPRPAVIVLHGFGGNKDAPTHADEARLYASWGYVVLRFDMRGCGESEGERGRILCLEQVADTRNAVTWLANRPDVDAGRIALSGQSFGAAVAVYTAGVDTRVAAVVSLGGWGDGLRKFRGQHAEPGAWARFSALLEQGRRQRQETGTSLMLSRWDIVPVPEPMRRHLPAGCIMEFPAETAESMCSFRADDVVQAISPRPLLLVHAAQDTVTPTEQSIELFRRAGPGAELLLLSGIDHFPFADDHSRLLSFLKGWFDTHFANGSAGRVPPRRVQI